MHMINAMKNVLRDSIPDITMPFFDDIPIEGCPDDAKDESIGANGCRRFVVDHISVCEKILQRLEGAQLTFSREKSAFGQLEILVVDHLCGPYGRKPSLEKVEAISAMREECGDGCLTVLGSMHLLPHLDSAIRAQHRAALWLAEERSEIRMERRTHGGGLKTKGDADGCTGSPESCIQAGHSGLHHSGH